jgi:hypothetical protein
MQDALVDPQTPCAAAFCAAGQVCVQATTMCEATIAGCTPADCGASTAGLGATPQACVMASGAPACSDVIDASYVTTYPNAVGDYVSLAQGPQGLGIVAYDRTRGNLVGASQQGGTWTSAILDGQHGANTDPNRVDTGDVGIGASLAIAANGDWHVSYSNGSTEALQYLFVPGGDFTKALAPEVADNGVFIGTMPYPDGHHIVGDDSSISVDASGALRIVYQDATAGSLLEVTAPATTGSHHAWTMKALAQNGRFAGFFPHYVPQTQSIANWFRMTDHTQNPPVVSGDVALVPQ